MSSEEDSFPSPQVDAQRPRRQHCTPKHFDDYILSHHPQRTALSSHPDERGHEEQRGATATSDGGIVDLSVRLGSSRTSPSLHKGDSLGTSALRQLVESMSLSERESRTEIAQLTNRLAQYEAKQRRRQELLEHITSFLQQEEEDDDDDYSSSSRTPLPTLKHLTSHLYASNHASTPAKQVHDIVPQGEGHVNTNSNLDGEERHGDVTSTPGDKLVHSSFKTIQHPSTETRHSPYSTVSSGMATPALIQQNHQEQNSLQWTTQRRSNDDFVPRQQPIAYPQNYPARVSNPPIQTFQFYSPQHYQPGHRPPLPPPPVVSSNYSAAPPQLPTHQVTTASVCDGQPRSIYGVPKPKIPNFTTDSEKEFANLKLALDNLLEPHTELTEKYKYHVLLEHLQLPEAQMIGQSCRHDPFPYSATMHALQLQYGQPHQLAQSEIAAILTMPDVKSGDARTFQNFALRVHLLVSMLLSFEGSRGMELNCCSHVDRLLSKLPRYLRDGFIEHLQLHGKLNTMSLNPYNLQDLNGWLQGKAQQQRLSSRLVQRYQMERPNSDGKDKISIKGKGRPVAVYHGAETQMNTSARSAGDKKQYKVHCLFCDSKEHYISRCPEAREKSAVDLNKWIVEGKRCWKCARSHSPEACTLKKPCVDCGDVHLQVLHNVAQLRSTDTQFRTNESRVYLTPSIKSAQVLLKVVPVVLHNKTNSMNTYAILDDGAQRTMILTAAVQQLQLSGEPETLALRTVRPDVTHLQGVRVSFEISPQDSPRKRYKVAGAFTAAGLDLVEQTYPIQMLQKRYSHLKGIPLKSFNNVRPLLLLGSDQVHLITATEPIRKATKGGPIAIRTVLGWALQGAQHDQKEQVPIQQCLFTSVTSSDDLLYRNVEKLWQLDVLPFRNQKIVTRSHEDQEAMNLLETKTQRLEVEGVKRYATPLLRKIGGPTLHSSIQSVMPHLRATEKRLKRDPEKATIYAAEIHKLTEAGYVKILQPEEVQRSAEAWYLPHHLVCHNNKPRLVFNCSFRHQGLSMNDQLLPGPALGPSLVGVLIRFRQLQVAVSGDIRAMFHQVRLLPEDTPLLRFIWRDMDCENPPDVYEWQVLPFGTTSSPCCAIFALQQHARNYEESHPEILRSVQQSFYVDNCLESFPTIAAAKLRVDQLRTLLADGGFDLRQWASNEQAVLAHLPTEARSSSTEQWLSQSCTDPLEPTLGLRWNCAADSLGYKYRLIEHTTLTMRTAYQVLASQYDPLGFMVPYTTRAKVLIQQLWSKQRGWDDPDLPSVIRQAWETWENELKHLNSVTIPRCYSTSFSEDMKYDLHVFCDASERAYGAVAYLAINANDAIQTSFVMARSRVAPKRQQSIPRLELCAALAGAQLAKLLEIEMTLPIRQTILWSDSTTVLEWLQSDSCRFKVFVGTRVSEIQELTDRQAWRYVDSLNNPADDITRGKTLMELTESARWKQGPQFLTQNVEHWPKKPKYVTKEASPELKSSTFCGIVALKLNQHVPDATTYSSWKELVEATQHLHGAAAGSAQSTSRREAEVLVLRSCQAQSFSEEIAALQAQKPVHNHSRLASLAPEWDAETLLIRVGGRLRRLRNASVEEVHPVVLDSKHPAVKLLIKEIDERLLHPGSERVYAEIRRQFWILRGRQAIRHHQLNCPSCQRWRAQPKVPQMADLPPQRLRLLSPPYYSTGVDCFGPYLVKIGRRTEKRWGLLFKCLTTRAVHIELLNSLDVDAFLLALRRFIARRGRPKEVLSDCGTNFRGAERELREAFAALEPELKKQLMDYQIDFKLNPPNAPHFGGIWEREVRSIKAGLRVAVGSQSTTEDVLHTILVEVEGILNSKPLGYVSADVADLDPITPNILLMGRRDATLPQAVYAPTRQKWRKSTGNLQENAVVLIVDPTLPRAQWPVGKVVKTVASQDGCVRTADVLVKGRIYTRPVARLIELPELHDDSEDTKDS
ncbi:uncharacterized protein LOC130908509 isoform X2 [Corythoichthys intestinalis]|uniref:uncharacterized protein LOC130908509 isoform X2 n=2 Tax=Corythoichthys intestinalis TaxID=161448 RepID=UPI0025A54285|nr:uncharacterized protein LOC130908509 isoform X2 [Corythoichthys intestinalis]